MRDEEPSTEQPEESPSDQTGSSRLRPAGEVVVKHQPIPKAGPPDKQIHPRRRLPPIPPKRPAESSKDDKNEE